MKVSDVTTQILVATAAKLIADGIEAVIKKASKSKAPAKENEDKKA